MNAIARAGTAPMSRSTQLVALSPSELPAAQRQVVDWCQQQIFALAEELKEQRQNAREASRMLWRNRWPAAIRRTAHRMVYYAKVKKAAQHGYLIVPNFDVDVIAVRVNRQHPVDEVDVRQATPDLLPPMVGRYVPSSLEGWINTRTWKDSVDGRERSRDDFRPDAYGTEIEFPAALVKPSILEATDRAMALRLFDRVGIVRKGRKSDPIVVGQIIHPKTPNGWQRRSNPSCVTFFVAWWLDVKDI